MKTLKKLLPLCLIFCLLVGCAPKEPAPAATPTAEVDGSMIRLTAGMEPGTVIATVDGTHEITIDDYLFWLSLYVDTYRNQGYPIDWSMDESGAMKEEFKAMILDVAVMYNFFSRHAAEAGLTLSEADEAQVQTEIDGLKTSMGEDFDFWLQSMYQVRGIEGFVENERAMYSSDMLYDHYFGENGINLPTEAEFAAYAERAEEYGVYNAKHILMLTVDDARQQLSEEERQAAYDQIHEIYDALVAAGPDEDTFNTYMFEHSQDTGLAAYPYGYEFGPGEMVPEFEYGTLGIWPNEMSEVIESSYGYHLIYRLPVAADSVRLRDVVLGTLWDEWLNGMQENLTVETSEVWDGLDVAEIDALRAAEVEAYYAAKTPETSPAA